MEAIMLGAGLCYEFLIHIISELYSITKSKTINANQQLISRVFSHLNHMTTYKTTK